MAEEASTREVVVPIHSADVPASDAIVEPKDKEVEGDTGDNGAKTEIITENEVATSGASATEESTIAYHHLNSDYYKRANHTSITYS